MSEVICFATAKQDRNSGSFTFTVNKEVNHIDKKQVRKDLQKGYMSMLVNFNQ